MSNKSKKEKGGFSYHISKEQLEAFARMSPLQRLQWADDARIFTLLGQTEKTRKRHDNLRRGLNIDD